ncbi:MAG: hypothetical protein ACO3O0_05120 [Bacteroidia bacterium]
MKKVFVVLLTAVLTIVFFAFFKFRCKETEQFEHLLQSGEYSMARDLISKTGSSDTLFYHTAVFQLELVDPNGNLQKALEGFWFLTQRKVDSSYVASVFNPYWTVLEERLKRTNQADLTGSFQKIAAAQLPQSVRGKLESYVKETAMKEQTVAAWNNCILFWHDGTDEHQGFLTARKRIYLDTLAIQKSGISIGSVITRNPCYIPILTRMDRINNRAFKFSDLYNADFPKNHFLAARYIVGDFNSVDPSGNCRGSYDVFAKDHALSEFKSLLTKLKEANVDPYDKAAVQQWYRNIPETARAAFYEAQWMWSNYLDKVHQYKTEPLNRDPVIEIKGNKYCIGQRMCLCEIKNDTIEMVAQFVTSSRNRSSHVGPLTDYDGQPRYYAPVCLLSTRYWDKAVVYDSLDAKRDKMMGFSSRHVIKYKGKVDLPNFMHMTPTDEYRRARGYVNGIHEFAVGGSGPAKYMGTPISLGCVRLHDYPSKFVRWWTPKNARFFINYEFSRYVQKVKD